jgi:hypothetical protein
MTWGILLAITKIQSPKAIAQSLSPAQLAGAGRALVVAALVFLLARQQGLWPFAVLAVILVELWPLRPGGQTQDRVRILLERTGAVVIGAGAAMTIAVSPRLATQIGAAVLYGAWIWWSNSTEHTVKAALINLLVVQVALFEALFLVSAVWRSPEWIVLILIWASCYASVFAALTLRVERMAGVMAATWALVATEISWVFLRWLFVYTIPGGYLLVPQPTIVLTAIAYCFGSIYISQRQGNLSRARLTEYLLIGLILITIVITGTPWRGSL